jgi:hypothetical protein
MKLGFPWNMALCCCSRVEFELSQCWFQGTRPVHPLLRIWQQALEERFTIPLAVSQIISWHTPAAPNLIYPCDHDTTCSIHLMTCEVLECTDPYGLIWPMILTMQMLFMTFNWLIQNSPYQPIQPAHKGYTSSRLWCHAFEIRLQ